MASQILGYLYLGSKNDAKLKLFLKEKNIKYILNCTQSRNVDHDNGCPNYYEKEDLYKYKRIPIFDNQGEDILPYIDTAIRFIEEGKHYGNVLLHCHKGISRSATFAIAYLMKKNEFTLDEALSYLQTCRPIVQPNSSFLNQLKKYEEILKVSSGSNIDNGSSNIHTVEKVIIGPAMPSSTNDNDINKSQPSSAIIPLHAAGPSDEVIVKEESHNHTSIKPIERPPYNKDEVEDTCLDEPSRKRLKII